MWLRRISNPSRDRTHHVSVPEIEADADVIKVRPANHLHQPVWRGKLVGNIFQQNPHSERLGEGAQVFDRSHGRFEFFLVETFVGSAQMLHQKAERNLLGDFESALDLVHGIDASGAVGGSNVDRRRAGASPLVVGIKRRVDGIQRNAAAVEPVGNFLDVRLAVGIVDVLPCGENLDGLHTAARQPVQNARMQPLFHE